MTYTRVEAGYARIMKLAMDADFPEKIKEWKAHLDQGRITTEMHDIFTVMGYPLPKPDRRRKHPTTGEPVDTSQDGIDRQVEAAAAEVVASASTDWGHTEIKEDTHPPFLPLDTVASGE